MKKYSKIFLSMGLALAGVAATGLACSKESLGVAKAETKRIYLDMTGWKSWADADASFKLWSWSNSTGDVKTPGTKISQYAWYVDLTVEASGFRWQRFNSTGTEEWSTSTVTWSSDTSNYIYYPTSYDGGNWLKPASAAVYSKNASWGKYVDLGTFAVDDGGAQFYSKSVSLTAGDEFKVVLDESNWLGYDSNNIESKAKSYLSGTSGNNIVVNKDCVVEIYAKPCINSYWIQISSEQEAREFSDNFLAATDPICAQGGNNQSALEDIWGAQKSAFESMTVGGKSAFNSNLDTTITNARARYVYIMGKYTLDAWTGGPALKANKSEIDTTTKDMTTAIIVATSVVSLIAVAGALLFIGKRKLH